MNARNPFQSSAQDWEDMTHALREAQEGRRHSEQLAIRLMADNDALTLQLTEANSERKFWMGYAVQIETRLDVITGVIQDARDEARDAAKRHQADRQPTQPPEQKPAPQAAAERPRRNLQDLPPVRRPVEVRHATPSVEPEETEEDISAEELVANITRLANKWP